MVSGLWTEGEKASGQMHKAGFTSVLSTNAENGGPRERGVLANKRAQEEVLSSLLTAMEFLQDLDTLTRGEFPAEMQEERLDALRKSRSAWLRTASDGRCPALVLLLPVTEMWKDFTEKPRYYFSGSSARLQARTRTHTRTHTYTRARTHIHTPLPVPNKDHII